MREILLVIFVVLALVIVFAAWRHRVRVRQARALADIGDTLSACRQLLQLVGHLQQHRGMSSAWLAGDASFKSRMQGKQGEIAALLPLIDGIARREAKQHCACLSHHEVSLFSFRWQTLLEELPGLSTEQSITQHSHLVATALEWLAALGESRIETLTKERRQVGAARNLAHRLPQLSECLGQARAIGSGVAARQSCAPVARVRLMFLISRAEALLEQAVQAYDAGPVSQRCRVAIEEMAMTVRTQMLLSSGVRVTPNEYFALATRAIDGVFEWINVCADEVKEVRQTAPAKQWALQQ